MGARLRFLKDTPCLTLLVVQLAGVLLYPFMEGTVTGRAAFSVFGLLVLAMVVRALRVTPFLTWVALLFAGPVVVLLAISIFTASAELIPWSAAFEAVLYVYAALSMLAYMLKDDDVSTDELFAIPAVFTLLAWAFAYVYVDLQALDPGSFSDSGNPKSWMDLLFLSFTILSSTGLSDILPLSAHARSVVMIEQLAGVFYIAMVVTRLVSLRRTRADRSR